MAKDYNEILKNQTVGSAPEPKPLPNGVYIGELDLAKIQTRDTKDGKRGIVVFPIKLLEATDSVDEDDLAEAGGLRTPSGSPKTVAAEYWDDPEAETGWSFVLDRFLAAFELDAGLSYVDAFEAIKGQQVTVSLKQETFKRRDGTEGTQTRVERVYAGVPA